MLAITAQEIQEWADKPDASQMFPKLIRKLILSSDAEITQIEMPAGKEVTSAGWDCRLQCTSASMPWVPGGLSGWELTTKKNFNRRINEDYEKRSRDPIGIEPAKATYVAVVPRRVSAKKKKEWVKKSKAHGSWKDILFYDASALEIWLEQSPTTTLWFAELLGKKVSGLKSIDNFWEEFSHQTKPYIRKEILFADREHQITQFQNRLENRLVGSEECIKIYSNSQKESALFAAAVLLSSRCESKTESWLEKTIVVEAAEARCKIQSWMKPCLVLLCSNDSTGISALRKAGHRIVLPLGRSPSESEEAILLPPPSPSALFSVLQAMLKDKSKALKLAYECGGNLFVLQRRLAIVPSLMKPKWASSEQRRSLLPALFAVKWNEGNESDKGILADLAKRSYDQWIETIQLFLNDLDPPIQLHPPFSKALVDGSIWELTAPRDAWSLLAQEARPEEWSRYQSISAKVLRKTDSGVSKELREGWMQGLLILALDGERLEVKLPSFCSSSSLTCAIIQEILSDPSFQQWESLREVLPLMAEAAPDAVLFTILTTLQDETSPLIEYFQTGASALDQIFFSCHYREILRALEILAWEPSSLSKVTKILGILVRETARRPNFNQEELHLCLRNIFQPTGEYTVASSEKKLAAIDLLLKESPKAGHQLLIDLLPRYLRTPSARKPHEPCWREWAKKIEAPAQSTVSTYLSGIRERVFKYLEGNRERTLDLLDCFPRFLEGRRKQFLGYLRSMIEMSEDDVSISISTIEKKVRKFIGNYKLSLKHQEEIHPGTLKDIETLYAEIRGKDIAFHYVPLFGSSVQDVESLGSRKIGEEESGLHIPRREAIPRILSSGGFDLLLRVARMCEEPFALGRYTALSHSEEVLEEQCYKQALGSKNENISRFIHGYLSQLCEVRTDNWMEDTLAHAKREMWGEGKLLNFFLGVHPTLDVWRMLRKHGKEIEKKYWSRIDRSWIPEGGTIEELRFAIERLSDAGRFFDALKRILHSPLSNRLPFALIAQILDGYLVNHQEPKLTGRMDDYTCEGIFKILDATSDLNLEEQERLEWLFFDLLKERTRGPIRLYERLVKNPAYFAKLVRLSSNLDGSQRRGDAGPLQRSVRTPSQETVISRARQVIDSWNGSPGWKDAQVDGGALAVWVDQVREELKETGKLGVDVGDSAIGKVFGRAFRESTGKPIRYREGILEPILDNIERIESVRLEDNVMLGIKNFIECFVKFSGEGGNQERELQKHYQEWAEGISADWPRCSRIFTRLAEAYGDDAKRGDAL